jgi:hypothetical protein
MYRFVHLIWSAYRYVFVLYVVQDASGNVRQFLAAGDEVLELVLVSPMFGKVPWPLGVPWGWFFLRGNGVNLKI